MTTQNINKGLKNQTDRKDISKKEQILLRLKSYRIETLTELKTLENHKIDICKQLDTIKEKIDFCQKKMKHIDIQHARTNIGRSVKLEPLKSYTENPDNSSLRLNYDIACIHEYLNEEARWINVAELVEFLNNRTDSPNYVIAYKMHTFSPNLGAYIKNDDRFVIQKKQVKGHTFNYYGLSNWK